MVTQSPYHSRSRRKLVSWRAPGGGAEKSTGLLPLDRREIALWLNQPNSTATAFGSQKRRRCGVTRTAPAELVTRRRVLALRAAAPGHVVPRPRRVYSLLPPLRVSTETCVKNLQTPRRNPPQTFAPGHAYAPIEPRSRCTRACPSHAPYWSSSGRLTIWEAAPQEYRHIQCLLRASCAWGRSSRHQSGNLIRSRPRSRSHFRRQS